MANDYTPQQIEEILQMFFDVAGTRQYIGARYVPIFGRGRGTSVDWDQSGAYEPLSIVYYQGDTYTSRRYVPAGIPIDDQDYWVITGRYNAQIEQYRQEVLSFEGKINARTPFPTTPYSPYGNEGQLLSTLGNGLTKWVDPVIVTSEIAEPLIDTWLDAHPEATTTVEDDTVTDAKLVQSGGVLTRVRGIINDIAHERFSNNLVDGLTYVDNAYVNVANGAIVLNQSNYFVTDYIPVTAGVFYRSNYGRNHTWYTADKLFISGVAGLRIQTGAQAPEGAAYLRLNVNKTEDGISTPESLYLASVSDYDENVLFGIDTRHFISGENYPNNLINGWIDNAFIGWNNGIISTNQPNYFATDYIPVTAGTMYKSNKGRNLAWYDSSKVYISGVQYDAIQSGVIAPTGAAYIRFTVNKTTDGIDNPDSLYFTSVDNYTHAEIANLPFDELMAKTDKIGNISIMGNSFPDNLIDRWSDDWNDNAYVITSTGTLETEEPNYFATDYIPVVAGITYKSNVGRNWAWYDSSKAYISGQNGTGIQDGIQAPSGAAYIRFTVNKTTDGIDNLDLLYFTDADDYTHAEIANLPIDDMLGGWTYSKKVDWIGDSIVDGPDFDEMVCDALNMTKLTTDGVDGGINGSTISLNGDGTDTRHALCARYSTIPNTADIVIVSCGTNDFEYAWAPIGTIEDADDGTSNTTFYGACKALCKGLIDMFPQKVIVFTTPIKRAQPFEDGNGGTYTPDGDPMTPFSKNKYGKTLGDYADMIKEVCGLYSIPVLDLYRESGLNPHLASQAGMFDNVGTHPNATAQAMMARRVCGWLSSLEYDL